MIIEEYGEWELISLERHNEGFGTRNKGKFIVDRDQKIIYEKPFGKKIFRSIQKKYSGGSKSSYFTINGQKMTARGIEGIRNPYNNIEKNFWGITSDELSEMFLIHKEFGEKCVFDEPRCPEEFSYLLVSLYDSDDIVTIDFAETKKNKYKDRYELVKITEIE